MSKTKKIIIIVLVIAVLVAAGVFAYIKIKDKKKEEDKKDTNIQSQTETKTETKTEVKKDGIDYLVLVNKQSKLPDDWEEKVELADTIDAWGGTIKVEKETLKKYEELKAALEKEGVHIVLDSVYRSVKEQQELWDDWTVTKGIDYVKKYVAVPGYSEHHTGLAVDICIIKDGKLIEENADMIAEREIFAKVHAKLSEYGFILRYPEGKDAITGYAYEPWHLRYVGSKLIAKEIMDKGLTFEEYISQLKKDDAIVGNWKTSLDNVNYIYTFNKDGRGKYEAGSMTLEFTYKASEDDLVILFEENTEPFETKFKIENDVLTIKDSLGQDVTYKKVK